jgi:hypothetical protein
VLFLHNSNLKVTIKALPSTVLLFVKGYTFRGFKIEHTTQA